MLVYCFFFWKRSSGTCLVKLKRRGEVSWPIVHLFNTGSLAVDKHSRPICSTALTFWIWKTVFELYTVGWAKNACFFFHQVSNFTNAGWNFVDTSLKRNIVQISVNLKFFTQDTPQWDTPWLKFFLVTFFRTFQQITHKPLKVEK